MIADQCWLLWYGPDWHDDRRVMAVFLDESAATDALAALRHVEQVDVDEDSYYRVEMKPLNPIDVVALEREEE